MEKKYITPWFYYEVYKTKNRIIHSPSKNLKKISVILYNLFKVTFGMEGSDIIEHYSEN